MEKPWRYFWFTLAVMALMLAVQVSLVQRAAPFDWGSAADWVSGFAAAGAAGLALHIANDSARKAAEIRSQEKADAVAAAAAEEVRVTRALLLVFMNGVAAARTQFKRMGKQDAHPGGIADAFLKTAAVTVVTRCLTELSVLQMPSSTSVDLLMSCRAQWAFIIDRMKAIKARSPLIPWDEELGDLKKAEQLIEALADEIVRRGGDVHHPQPARGERPCR